ncbi:hypothetical protein BH23BAC1_BH23BAC1_50300 [soil metagenome]
MVSIQTFKNGQIIDIKTGELYSNIIRVSEEHKVTNRALAFGFILYNSKNPQIVKILNGREYWKALKKRLLNILKKFPFKLFVSWITGTN